MYKRDIDSEEVIRVQARIPAPIMECWIGFASSFADVYTVTFS